METSTASARLRSRPCPTCGGRRSALLSARILAGLQPDRTDAHKIKTAMRQVGARTHDARCTGGCPRADTRHGDDCGCRRAVWSLWLLFGSEVTDMTTTLGADAGRGGANLTKNDGSHGWTLRRPNAARLGRFDEEKTIECGHFVCFCRRLLTIPPSIDTIQSFRPRMTPRGIKRRWRYDEQWVRPRRARSADYFRIAGRWPQADQRDRARPWRAAHDRRAPDRPTGPRARDQDRRLRQ